MRRLLPVVWLLIGSWGLLYGQQKGFPFIRNYSPREFKASSANYAAVQDPRGVMYFGNYRGILEYDGANWQMVPMPRSTQVRSMAVDSLGRVYAAGSGEFGYLAPDSLGQQRFHSLLDRLTEPERNFTGPVRAIGAREGAYFQVLETQALYYYTPDTLIGYDLSTLPENVFVHLIEGYLHASPRGEGLLRLERGAFRPVPGSEALHDLVLIAVQPLRPGEVLLRTYQQGFFRMKYEEKGVEVEPWPTEVDDELEAGIFSSMTRLHTGHLLVGTFKQGAYELDAQGRLVQHIDEEIGLRDNIVLGSFQDQQNSLWLMLSRGISRIEIASPLSHFGPSAGLPGIVYATARHRGRLYASTPLGAFRLEGQHFEPVSNLGDETWKFFTVPGRQPHLLVNTLRGLFEIRGRTGYALAEKDYFLDVATHPARPDFGVALSGTEGPLAFRFHGDRFRWEPQMLPDLPTQDFQALSLTADGDLWLLPGNQQQMRLLRLSLAANGAYQLKEEFQVNDMPAVKGMYRVGERLCLVTEGGLYTWQDQGGFALDQGLNAALQQPDLRTGYLISGPQQQVWVERIQGQQRWLEVLHPQQDGSYRRDSLRLHGVADLELWGQVYVEDNGLAWLGTPEGLYCYNTRYQDTQQQAIAPLIRRVMLGEDSLLYAGTPPHRQATATNDVRLPAGQHSLTFHYAAPYFTQETNTEYRYRLQGWEEDWSPWTTQRKKDYTLLPPGNYLFEVQARDAEHTLSPVAVYRFAIAPPWYRRPWAFALYGILVAFLIWGTVKLNTHRLHLKNEHLERLVFERTNEIWEQHKEIIKTSAALKRQKEAVAEQAALLEEKNKALNQALEQLKATQSQLVESEKMASLGQLTAGIAHEINNPINYVKNNVGPLKRDFADIKALFLLIRQLKEDQVGLKRAVLKVQQFAEEIEADYLFEEMEALLRGIEEGAQRTKVIVDGLKTFSRSEKDHFKAVDIHAGLDSTLTLLNNKLKDRIEVERVYSEMSFVECLPGKLNQVFMNILSNAVQAIEQRSKEEGRSRGEILGKISIRTDRAQHCLPGAQDCVRIAIQDDGVGMKPEVKNRIFEPFFTTKDVGEGTGLGLAITFGIVEQHRGRIEVRSAPGEGSTFTIILPFQQEEARSQGKNIRQPSPSREQS